MNIFLAYWLFSLLVIVLHLLVFKKEFQENEHGRIFYENLKAGPLASVLLFFGAPLAMPTLLVLWISKKARAK